MSTEGKRKLRNRKSGIRCGHILQQLFRSNTKRKKVQKLNSHKQCPVMNTEKKKYHSKPSRTITQLSDNITSGK